MVNMPVYTAGTIKSGFFEFIDDLNPAALAKDPSRDFTRSRKLPLKETLLTLLLLGKDCLDTEMRKLFRGWHKDVPSKSAFVQQRAKLSDHALPSVFKGINDLFLFEQTLNGVHILAADGTDQNVPPDGKDSSYFISYNSKRGGYCQNHVNTVYDVLEKRFVDVLIQPRKEANEGEALREMVLRSPLEGECLYIMDRGYNCFNLMAAIRECGHYFLIRGKDVGNGSILDSFELPEEEEYDINLTFYISKAKAGAFRGEAGFKHIRTPQQRFDYLDETVPRDTYILPFRLVKVRLETGHCEYLITNLPEDRFPQGMMKHLYHLRWDCEEAYFMLKYKANLVYHHSRKKEYIVQEIYARLILYNLTSLLESGVNVKKKNTKYEYRVNKTQAFVTCRMIITGELQPGLAEKELLRYLTPVRPGRKYGRNMRSQRLTPLNNRN